MAADEILSRIDQHIALSTKHIAKSNEHMERGNEHMERNNQHMERSNELMAEIRREHELNRAAFAENARVMGRLTEVLIQLGQTQKELQADVRAQTAAIFRLLDRFGGGSAGPATASA